MCGRRLECLDVVLMFLLLYAGRDTRNTEDEEEEVTLHWVLLPNSHFRFGWDLVQCFILIYVAVAVPLRVRRPCWLGCIFLSSAQANNMISC